MLSANLTLNTQRQDGLAIFIAAGLLTLCPATLAQSSYNASGYLSQEALSTLLQTRSSSTEVELRKLALTLLDYYDAAEQTSPASQTLKMAPLGTVPAANQYFGSAGSLTNSHFLYLPDNARLRLSATKDANNLPIAYCTFNFPGQPAVSGRLAGSTTGITPRNAIGLVLISAGANGRYEYACDDFRELTPGQQPSATQASEQKSSNIDDVYVMYTFNQISYSGAKLRYMESAVTSYADFTNINPSDLYDGQIRWVKNTNQFFRYDASATPAVWQPLNAGFKSTVNTVDRTQLELNWLSGSMGMGTDNQSKVGGTEAKAMLTLGSRQQDMAGTTTENTALRAGIGFNKTNNALFAYIGLLDDNTFVLRQGETNRLALDAAGNLTLEGTTLTVKGQTSFNDPLTAKSGISSTTGTFSGQLSAKGGFDATTATFSGLIAANGGLSATTGTFSGLLSANGGISATSGTFSGNIGASGDISGRGAAFAGPLSATNGGFSGVLSGGSITTGGSLTAGSIATSGSLSSGALSATTGDFSGLLNANGGLKATTGEFSGLLSANGGLNVIGNVEISGDLTLKGKLITGNVTTLKFFAPSIGNSGFTEIGSAQFTSTTGLQNVNLNYANKFFESINQKLGTVDTPIFTALKVGTFNSEGIPISLGTIQGNLQGTAERLNQTLTLEVKQLVQVNEGGGISTRDLGTQTATFNLGDAGNKSQRITLSGYLDQRDQRSATINNPSFSAPVTVNCNINGSQAQTCDVTAFSVYVSGNANANFNGQSSSYTNTLGSGGDLSILAAKVAALENAGITISLTGDILSTNSQSVRVKLGETANLSLNTASNLNYAKNMDQDVRKNSTVTFAQLTVTGDGLGAFGRISTKALTVTENAVIQSYLQMNNTGGTPTIKIDGHAKTINFIGGGGTVTAQTFIGDLIGNADTATKLKNPIVITVNGGTITGTSSTPDNINYTLNLALADNAVSTSKIQDLAITTGKIADNAISTSKIQDLAITNGKIANNAISTLKIQDAAISTAKLQDLAITTGKLQDLAITTGKIANGNVTTEKLAAGATIDNARALISPSDIRLKEGIITVEGLSLLERLSKINLFGYSFRDDPTHARTLGVIAQELQPLFPELVSLQTEGKHAGYFAVNYGLMGALATAGVGHLNKKIDNLGLQVKDPRTLSATLPNFTVSNITAERIETQKLKAQEIEAGKGSFEDLKSDKFSAISGKATRMQADTINSGTAEGFAGLGSALPLFGGGEGHYIVNVSSPDGSYATASVFISNGQIHVVPMATQNISIVPSMGMVHAVANGKVLKATWLKTG